MAYQTKQEDDIIYFWDNATGEQMLYDAGDRTGALAIEHNEIKYTGCWTSRPEVIRANCDKTFIGKDEIVDTDGTPWTPNVFKQNGIWYSMNDSGIEMPTNKINQKEVK